MPMLPPGLTVSIVVDLAAVSVALTEAGVNVAAVALSAAHCKVNVGLEVCDCELGVPLDGGVGADGGSGGLDGIIADRSDSRVAAKLGLLLTDVTWTAPAVRPATITEASGGGGGPGGSLSVETLVSSAAVKLEPEGFDLLEAVHARVLGRFPLGAMGAADPPAPPTGGGDGGGHTAPPRDDGDLAEKLRERLSRGDEPVAAATLLLPPRPVLSRRHGGGAGAGTGAGAGGGGRGVSERPQLGVAVTPVRFNLTEPHMLGLARFAMDASDRLAVVYAGPSSSPSPPHLVRSQHGESVTAVVEVDSATDEPEWERIASVPVEGSQAATVATTAVAESPDAGAVDVATRSNKSDQATAVANGRGAAAPSPPPPEGGREPPQGVNDAPAISTLPRHQVSNGPPRNNDATLGEGDRQHAGEGVATSAAAVTTPAPETVAAAKAPPVPPAFLGTFIVDAISVMLLEEEEEEDSGQRTGGGRATAAGARPAGGGYPEARINGVARKHPAPTDEAVTATAVPATHRRRRGGGGEERHRGTRAAAIPGTRDLCYSGLVFLEIEGIGVGVDVPSPGAAAAAAAAATAAQSSPVMHTAAAVAAVAVGSTPDEQGGGRIDQQQQQQQCRAEFAIKRISLTDVSERRRRLGALAKLVSGDGIAARSAAAAAADDGPGPAAGSAQGGEDSRGRENGGGDELRVLSAGWWRQPPGTESGIEREEVHVGGGGYDEQVLLRARVCPVSGTATADARLASGRFVLLAAPLLDVFGVVAGVQRGLARGPSCRAESGVVAAALESEESSLGARGGGEEGNSARVDEASTAGGVGPADEKLLRPSAARSPSPPPPQEEGRSGDAATGIPEEEEDGRRNNWRWQASRALIDAGPAEMLWLRRIDVSASAHDLQLWLPGGASAAAAVDGEAGVEAIVAACGRCHAALSIAVGLVTEGPAGAVSSVERSPRAAGPPTTPPRAAPRGDEEKADAADFPLAACIMTNSLGPLLLAVGGGSPPPSSTRASSGPGAAAAAATDGAASTPLSLSHGGGRGPGESPAGVAANPPPVPPSTAALPAATAVSELATMWTCRGRFQAAGARMKIVNNFYRQKRPAVVVKVGKEAPSRILFPAESRLWCSTTYSIGPSSKGEKQIGRQTRRSRRSRGS
ncbi:unnamed protein product [Ectocarpus sp. 12 AP-2014]